MQIVTTFPRFPEVWQSASGVHGTAIHATSAREFSRYPDALCLINGDARLVQRLVLAGRSVVAVDLQFPRPPGWRARLATRVKRLVYRRVPLFINYFHDDGTIASLYGLTPDRTAVVPFKANLWAHRVTTPQPDGDSVLCFGRSRRDYDTFFAAMERVGLPGVVVDPTRFGVVEHGGRFSRSLSDLPPTVRVVADDGSEATQIALLRAARVVALPVVPTATGATGISTILNAMAFGKCVVTTDGMGTRGLFTDELLTVPPDDPEALANAIRRAWCDDTLRTMTAARGLAYATACGSEADLFQRILDAVTAHQTDAEWVSRSA